MEFSAATSSKRQPSRAESARSGRGPEENVDETETSGPAAKLDARDVSADRNLSSGVDLDAGDGDVLLLRYPAQVVLLVDAANIARQVDSVLELRGGSCSAQGLTHESRELHLALSLPKRLALLTQLKQRELDACTSSLRSVTAAPLADAERHRLLHVLELLILQKLNQRDALSGRFLRLFVCLG